MIRPFLARHFHKAIGFILGLGLFPLVHSFLR